MIKRWSSASINQSSRRGRRQRAGLAIRSRRLAVELLESRALLSTITVTTTSDAYVHTGISLRDVVAQANAVARSGNPVTIGFAANLSGQTITLAQGQLELGLGGAGNGVISIDGSGLASPITISGNNASRLFMVDSGVSAALNNLVLNNGGGSNPGGAIYNAGTLTVSDDTLSGNAAPYSDGSGIYNCGTLTVNGSTISNNSNPTIWGASGDVTIDNSTISGNGTGNQGSGIVNESASTMAVTNCTISGNTGGIGNSGTLTLYNTIVALNGGDIGGSVSGSDNLIGDASGIGISNGVAGNLVGTSSNPINPLLGPLQNNGGPTQTMALQPGDRRRRRRDHPGPAGRGYRHNHLRPERRRYRQQPRAILHSGGWRGDGSHQCQPRVQHTDRDPRS
jgi:hypothetical protein